MIPYDLHLALRPFSPPPSEIRISPPIRSDPQVNLHFVLCLSMRVAARRCQGFWLIYGCYGGFLAVRCTWLHVGARPWADPRSAHPSVRVSEAKLQNPGRTNAPREREGCLTS